MVVLTVGNSYIDIDGYASCIAYRELLKLQGIEAKFVTNAVYNYSVTNSLLDLAYSIDQYEVNKNDSFIMIDLSNRDFFPDFVKEENVIELIDHHTGFEKYWKDKLGSKAVIEPIGAVATIVFERYEQYNLLEKVGKDIAKLLMAAILDNTLNFTAEITSERDKRAFNKLQEITGDINFADSYFRECQSTIEANLEEAIVNDLKFQVTNEYLPEMIGQLTIWDIDRLKNKKDEIKKIMNSKGKEWIINVICLKDNTSYIICSNDRIKHSIKELFECYSNEEIVEIRPARLRKEIMAKSLKIKERMVK